MAAAGLPLSDGSLSESSLLAPDVARIAFRSTNHSLRGWFGFIPILVVVYSLCLFSGRNLSSMSLFIHEQQQSWRVGFIWSSPFPLAFLSLSLGLFLMKISLTTLLTTLLAVFLVNHETSNDLSFYQASSLLHSRSQCPFVSIVKSLFAFCNTSYLAKYTQQVRWVLHVPFCSIDH